ncbi:tRNA (guanine(46)-N(7))-methyltransferase TrmB [Ellagibacter isourolithinifaciens]|uniref:tRNA (guanine(46)-N(7))-methyltransferase TrmB n=1 Tax=Ellagibacter isourolithinifaciens TaxID=2137581 RepID=UPI003A8CCEBB
MEGAKAALEFDPSARRGAWRLWAPEGGVRPDGEAFSRVVLDLGCGKGEYTVARAEADPETLFVGIDVDPICVMRSAEAACEASVGNVVFVHDEDPDVFELFDEGELASILINFPTPFPKKKRAPRRLTYLDRLMKYRLVLEEGGTVRMRTDSTPFRDFSLTQLDLAGYQLEWETDDVRGMFPDEPWSGYERKLVAKGAPVVGFCAVPGPAPEHVEQTAPLSLVSYLPEDLESLDYIPFGMQGSIDNIVGYNANRRKKGLPDWRPPIV